MTTSAQPPRATGYRELIDRLDLPAKVRLLTGAATFSLHPQESIGLAELRMSDGPTGVRGLKFSGGRIVALLPNATLLAASWDDRVAAQVGRILAEEAMAQQIHVVLGPTINLHRSPLGGRLFEAYSEDPLLTGRIAAGYVRGMQESRVAACVKHFVANESETDRNTVDCVVDEATLREVYLLPFEIAVAESNPWTLMAAYNDVNGTPATEHGQLINEVLKGEWAYDGLVVSDWFATKSAAPAANGGLDLVMPGPAGPWGEALVAAVTAGDVAEPTVDGHLARLLRLADRVGVLGEPREYPVDLPAPDSATRREQLTRLAAAGMVVLKNDGAALPLDRSQRVAVIGRHALDTIGMGGGSAHVNPPYQVSIAAGLRATLGAGVRIVDGVEVRGRPIAARPSFVRDPVSGETGMRVRLFAADGTVLADRHEPQTVVMTGFDDDLPEPVAKVVLRARVEGAVDAGPGPATVEVGAVGVGDWTVRAGGQQAELRLRVAEGGLGAEILTPPGEAFPVRLDASREVELTATRPADRASGSASPTATVGFYGLIARPARRPDADAIAAAVAAARESDVAVVVVGLTEEQETEAADKTTLALPGAQDALVSAVAAAAPRTVVVLNAATPVLMPWLAEVDAVVYAGLPGQEAGRAVAAALLGDIEPAGRLVTSFPVADGAAPAWSVTPEDGTLRYAEGPFVGYRGYFAGCAPAPAFWFGHGLGYGSWEYGEPRLVGGSGRPSVAVRVTNSGSRSSREVVQVYFQPADPASPVRLVGWTLVDVEPGASANVTVDTDARLFRRWDAGSRSWQELPSRGKLLVARGLGDIRGTLDT